MKLTETDKIVNQHAEKQAKLIARWPVLKAEYTEKPYRMVSGQGTVYDRTYRKVQGNKYTWYIPLVDNAAAGIHVDRHDPRSDGYGGSILEFKLEDGTVDKVKGPWHSNSDALYADTGVDLRGQYYTRVVLARNRVYSGMGLRGTFIDVFYFEEEPVKGVFNRYIEIVQRFLDENPEWDGMVFYHADSEGGSSSGGLERESPTMVSYRKSLTNK
jgi:hypothetical protein